MELRLDRQIFFPDEWRIYFTAVASYVWPSTAARKITVPPMSAAWLREHNAEHPKHPDEMSQP